MLATFESDYETPPQACFFVPSAWLREPNLSSEQHFLVTFTVTHHPAKAGFIGVCFAAEI